MNAGGYVLAAILLIVLLAVAVGATQMDFNHTSEFEQLMKQRDEAVSLAQEATTQRDVVVSSLSKEKERAAAALNELQKKTEESQALTRRLSDAQLQATQRQNELNQARDENAVLQGKISQLQGRNDQLEREYNAINTGGGQQAAVVIPATGQVSYVQPACTPMVENLAGQLSTGLAVLVGMVALSSGGYVFYRSDPNRKVSVKMTREQVKDYARYQRERCQQAAVQSHPVQR